MGFLLFYFLFALLVSTPATVHSRTSPHGLKTTTVLLDVAASTKKTTTIFALDSETTVQSLNGVESEGVSSSSSSLSLQLHSRASLHKPSHGDYKLLTLARLERDSARVRSLTTRLDLALGGVSHSDLKPAETETGAGEKFAAEELQSPIVSGTSQGSGEYFCRVGIGKPASQVYMVLDTGSDVNWVQCAPCAECYEQVDPIYEPSSSSSYSRLSCEAQQCKSLDVSECRNDTCLYEVSYGDGSYTVGDFITETITLNSASVSNVAIGCGHTNEGLFIGAAGLLGLGGGALSFPSQLNAKSFSYCLVDRDSNSASTLEFDAAFPPNAVTAPLNRNPELDTFLYIGMEGLSVGGELLPIPTSLFQVDGNGNGGIIVDSGTAVTRLQTDAYVALRDAFVRGTRHLQSTDGGVALFDTCYDLSSKTSVNVPTVSFNFVGGKVLQLPAKNFLIPIDSNGTFCFAFAPMSSPLSIIGNVQQQGTRVGFDLANSLVGFTPNDCCDLYQGQWIFDSVGPLYTNNTCPVLTQMQNCQGNGRPDKDYENWRWKPEKCDLPRFDVRKFLDLMRGKTIAFIGDSVARNQMESLLCILWQVEVPKNRGNKKMQRYYFRSTSVTVVRIWSSWLVKQTSEPVDFAPEGVAKLHLDAPDDALMEHITGFDVIVLSSGHWFAKQSVYLLNNEIVGGQLWWPDKSRPKKINNIQAFGISVETILTALGTNPNYKGLTIVRSYSPDHYEGGAWNTGGSCTGKTKPLAAGEIVENGFTNVMHEKQVTGFNRAIKKVTNKSKLILMDITRVFEYRHDGHPGPYRNMDPNKLTKRGPDGKPPPQDCLHWCMPGPVDTWNELVLEIIRREYEDSTSFLS